MILIYWKWKVGKGIAGLCDYLNISYEIKDDTDAIEYTQYDFIIPSPGIPSHHIVYKSWKVKSELDFVYSFLPKDFRIIAVTGTDGKSTTSWILYELLRNEYGSDKVYLSGNFDIPFSETVREILQKWQKRGYIVLEVSSFMAYSLKSFECDYAIFTNFKPDHLNWHKDLQDYLNSKMHLLIRARKKAVLCEQILTFAENEWLELSPPKNSRYYTFDPESENDSIKEKRKDRTNGENIIISGRRKYLLSETNFSWNHNALNILSATIVTNEMGICSKHTKEYLKNITWLPHRLEKIGEKHGVIFVEDSKSTSAQSLEAALSSYGQSDQKNLLLIVWWSDKWDSFEWLSLKLKNRVKAMVCIWATKDTFLLIAKREGIPSLATDSLTQWVEWLYNQSNTGDVLMLSPGCASFWLFRDYLDRANQFREAIKKLP